MMGPKKLSEIKGEIRRALAATGEDPIEWVEKRIAARKGPPPGSIDVLESLRQFLEGPPPKKRRVKARGRK
jgi:hypothetical protein